MVLISVFFYFILYICIIFLYFCVIVFYILFYVLYFIFNYLSRYQRTPKITLKLVLTKIELDRFLELLEHL